MSRQRRAYSWQRDCEPPTMRNSMGRKASVSSRSFLSRRSVIGVGLTLPVAFGAKAETYPSRSPHMIVPFAAGGPTDVLARIVAEQVGPRLGQQIIVESRAGAGGNIAGEYVARSGAD